MNLSDAIQQFTADRRAKGARPATVRAEKHTLSLLLSDVGNVQLSHLQHRHLDLFWANRTTWGEGSMNRARYHLSSFFQWCQARGHIKRDIDLLHGSKKLRVPERPRIVIPQAEFETFLEGIKNPRTRAMCAIGLYLFTRISETSLLRWQDVNFEDHTVTVTRQKTATVDVLPMSSELESELKRWRLEYAARIGRNVLPSDFVIPYVNTGQYVGVKGQRGVLVPTTQPVLVPTKKTALNHALAKALKEAGYYQKHEGGHTLRRSGAIALYYALRDRGHDSAIRICQWMLGHKSIQTTEVYLRLGLEKKTTHDLLAGQRMFPANETAPVIELGVTESA